jgi:hypothetical protein
MIIVVISIIIVVVIIVVIVIIVIIVVIISMGGTNIVVVIMEQCASCWWLFVRVTIGFVALGFSPMDEWACAMLGSVKTRHLWDLILAGEDTEWATAGPRQYREEGGRPGGRVGDEH